MSEVDNEIDWLVDGRAETYIRNLEEDIIALKLQLEENRSRAEDIIEARELTIRKLQAGDWS